MLNICCFYCERCKKQTHFVPIYRARSVTGVSRSTIYYWMDRDWVHWIELPSRRKVICVESLSRSKAEPLNCVAKGVAA